MIVKQRVGGRETEDGRERNREREIERGRERERERERDIYIQKYDLRYG